MNRYIIILVCGILLLTIITIIFIFNKRKENFNCNTSNKDAYNSIIKVVNIIQNQQTGYGWVVNDGYPSPTIIQFNKNIPEWLKSLKPYERVFISTQKPKDIQCETMKVNYVDTAQIGWLTLGSGKKGEDAIVKCCVDKNNVIIPDQIYKNYGSKLIYEEGYTYVIKSDNGYALFWLGINSASNIPPYPLGTEMYIFPQQ